MVRIAVLGYLSIDEIRTPAGVTATEAGGGALYGALGVRAAGGAAAIFAAVGADYPEALLSAIAAQGVGVTGVVRRDGPTRRSSQIHEASGRRTSPHFGAAAWWERTRVLVPPLPEAGRWDAWILCPMPAEAALAAAAAGRGVRAFLAADTSAAFARTEGEAVLRLAGSVDLFAPSREETWLLLPGLDDDTAVLRLARGGTRVLHKRGADGLVYLEEGSPLRRVPAPEAAAVDPTGAGDATLGAFVARLAAGDDAERALEAAREVAGRAIGDLGPRGLGLDPLAGC
jgi:ribokinase